MQRRDFVAEASAKLDDGLQKLFNFASTFEQLITLGLGSTIDHAVGVRLDIKSDKFEQTQLAWLQRANAILPYITFISFTIAIPDSVYLSDDGKHKMAWQIGGFLLQVSIMSKLSKKYPQMTRYHYTVDDFLFFFSGMGKVFVEHASWNYRTFYFLILWHRIITTCLLKTSFTASIVHILGIALFALRDAGVGVDDIIDLGITYLTQVFASIVLVILLIYVTLRAKMLIFAVQSVEASKVTNLRTIFQFVSHEYRNHFFAGSLALDSLTSNHLMPRNARDDVKVLERAHKNISALMENILQLSRLEANGGSLKGQSINFSVSSDLLAEVRSFAQSMIDANLLQKHVQFIYYEDPAIKVLPSVTGSLALLQRALNNLLSNAIKFTPNDGLVRLVVNAFPDFPRKKVQLDIVVSDTGSGIAETDLEDIFKPFKRSRTGDSLDLGGSGLGLSFVKRIIEANDNGSIAAESTLGHGSNFHVRFDLPFASIEPQNEGSVSGDSLSSSQSSSDGSSFDIASPTPRFRSRVGPLRLLIVDDSITNRLMLRNFINRQVKKLAQKVDIVEAADGRTAIDLVETRGPDSFDAITMDHYMPGKFDGLDAAKKIRELGFTGPLIGVTGEEDPENMNRFRSAGCDAIWRKGGQLDALLKMIGIDSSRTSRRTRQRSLTPTRR
mmetsp:Transcript_22735/g.44622  ORF Transcript_22735/g.44622 Transcript_22735/m.44622 type:complete len:669 (+) Transcript_22735:340-2346(+)